MLKITRDELPMNRVYMADALSVPLSSLGYTLLCICQQQSILILKYAFFIQPFIIRCLIQKHTDNILLRSINAC